MSLVNLAHVCSHLQNASRARLAITSIPLSNLHLSLSLQLQKAGLVSTVTIAGPTPPPASALLAHPPRQQQRRAEGDGAEGEAAAGGAGGHDEPVVTQANRASRRLWLGLKYWNNEPVLGRMGLVSKPTRRIWMGVDDLRALARGDRKGYVLGVRGVGECMFVSTDRGVMEIRECIERGVGGMVLCRAL
jgi:ribosomal protein S8